MPSSEMLKWFALREFVEMSQAVSTTSTHLVLHVAQSQFDCSTLQQEQQTQNGLSTKKK